MQTHRPFLFITLAYIIGIAVENGFHFPAIALFAAFGVLTVGTLVLSRGRIPGTLAFLLAVAVFGAFAFHNARTLPREHVFFFMRQYYGKAVTVKGVIASDIQKRSLGRGEKISFVLDIRETCFFRKCQARSGKVMVNIFDPVDVRYGDEIMVSGKLHRPFDYGSRGRLSYRSYLAQKKVFLMLSVKKGGRVTLLAHGKGNPLKAASLGCREKLNALFDRYLSRAEAGLMQALITGERSEIPPHVREIFFRTGTVHILAISGMNIAMVAFGLFLFLNLFPIPRRLQMALTLVFIWTYAFMTGGNAPVLRATVMSSVPAEFIAPITVF